MVGLTDLLGLLDRWDEWKKLKASPDRIDALERELAELRERLGPPDRWPPDVCRSCGARALRMEYSMVNASIRKVMQTWRCKECKTDEKRLV